MSRQVVHTDHAPAAVGPYSQGIISDGKYVFVSGQIGLDPATGKMVEGGLEAQAKQVFENLKAVLVAAGTSLDNAVKMTVMLNDINNFAELNKIYATYFGEEPPARATFGVQLPVGALIEIDCIAWIEN